MAITTDEGSYQDYGYTGGMQSIGIPFEGIFKFEVWGAGGTNLDQSGRGGYSVGYRLCNGGETFFICVGGSKSRYNGGGWSNAGYGGGATHIATANALLRDLAGNKGAVLLVAGGGGGAGGAAAGADGLLRGSLRFLNFPLFSDCDTIRLGRKERSNSSLYKAIEFHVQ